MLRFVVCFLVELVPCCSAYLALRLTLRVFDCITFPLDLILAAGMVNSPSCIASNKNEKVLLLEKLPFTHCILDDVLGPLSNRKPSNVG